MTQQATRNFPECREPCVHRRSRPVVRVSGAAWDGVMLRPRGAELAALVPVEPGMFFSPRATATNLRDAFPVR